jgi:hypothetical protein
MSVYYCCCLFCYRLSLETFGYTLVYMYIYIEKAILYFDAVRVYNKS